MRPSNNLEKGSLRQILKNSTRMYERSESQFFRTFTGIESGPGVFDETRFIMTFLTILAVTEISCSWRLVLEEETGKVIAEPSRLEFLEKFLANTFALSDAEDKTSGSLNRGIADLLLLRTLLAIRQKSRKPSFWEVIDPCFVSICKFGSLKNPSATTSSLSELFFRSRRFILLVQTKNAISMNYGSSTSSWKPWRWGGPDLIFTIRGIFINSNLNPLIQFTSSSRSSKLKVIFSWNISQMITRTVPISTRIVVSYTKKRSIPLWVWRRVNGNWDNNMIRISEWRESHCKTDTSFRRCKQIQKSRTVRVTVRDPGRKVNHLSKVICDTKIITKFTNSFMSTRIG